jgi:hypothetical protein
MSASDNALEQKIIALEQELALYKSQQVKGLLNFEFLFNAIKQPAFLIESKKPSGTPLITKINKSGLELIKYNQSEVENLNPVDIGLFDSTEQFANFCNSLSTAESAIFLAKKRHYHLIGSYYFLFFKRRELSGFSLSAQYRQPTKSS